MKKLTTNKTIRRVPAGIIRGRIYNQNNKVVMLIIKQGPNFIKHVL